MMKFISFLLLCLSTNAWAQNEDSIAEAYVVDRMTPGIKKYAERTDARVFENYLHDSLHIGNYRRIPNSVEFEDLPLAYNQVFDSFCTANIPAETYCFSHSTPILVHTNICLIRHGNRIIYLWFSDRPAWTIDDPKYSAPRFEYVDTTIITELSRGYQSVFGRSVSARDFFKERAEYGYSDCGCLYAGSLPAYDTLLQFVNRKSIPRLEAWLSSPTLEWQLFAVMGFSMLKQNGYRLTKEQLDRVRYIKNRTGFVAGCGEDEKISVEEAMKEFIF